jgi:hypothetical protein
MNHVRHLILVLGDQLEVEAAALYGFDPAQGRGSLCPSVKQLPS